MPGLTPYGACVSLSAVLAALLLAALRRCGADAHRVPVKTLLLVCVPSALVGARLFYCLFRLDFFVIELGPLSILEIWRGGFLLYGAALGACLAAALAAKKRGDDVAGALDELAAPGLLAICVCRLAERFTTEGVGTWVESPAFCRFPFAVTNEYGEWQLAVFLWEAAAAAVILLLTLRVKGEPGARFETALALYACCQIVFESLRMDGVLRIGFVRVSQVLSGAAVFGVALARGLRRGAGRRAALPALGILPLIALAGGIEWALDKTDVPNQTLYALMALDCALMAALALRAGCDSGVAAK